LRRSAAVAIIFFVSVAAKNKRGICGEKIFGDRHGSLDVPVIPVRRVA